MANFNKLPNKPHNEIIVAKKGGDERRIQKALDSAKDIASHDSELAPVLVHVKPGTYTEDSGAITVWDDVILQGCSEGAVYLNCNLIKHANGQVYNIVVKAPYAYSEVA